MQKKIGPIFYRLGILFPWLTLVFFFYKYSLNLPVRDDHRVFIGFQKYYFKADTFLAKLQTILIPDNESHPIFMRTLSVLQTYIDGEINFQHILIFCWVFIVIVWWIYFRGLSKSKTFRLIFGLWILNLLLYELFFRTDVATYQMATFGLSVFVLYASTLYKNSSIYWKFLFFVVFFLAPTGSINGFIANGLVIIYLGIKKEKRALWISLILFSAQIIIFYFLSDEGKSISLFENIKRYNYELVIAFFMSLGGIFNLNHSFIFQIISAILGFGFFSFTAYYLFIKRPDFVNFKSLLFLFSALSLAAIVTLRYNYWLPGYSSIFESRYKIYGVSIILIAFSIFYEKFKSKFINGLIVVTSVLIFAAGVYKGIFLLEGQQLTQITDSYNIGEGSLKQDFAIRYLTTNQHALELKQNGIFDFYDSRNKIQKLLDDSQKLEYKDINLSEKLDDPLNRGDWAKMEIPLQRITVNGSFPRYNYYIIKFTLKNGKHGIYFLMPPIKSLRQKISGNPKKYNYLSHTYYFDFFEGFDPQSAEVYGLDSIDL